MKKILIIMLVMTLFMPLAGATVSSIADCDGTIITHPRDAASEIGDFNSYMGTSYSSYFKLGDNEEWNSLDGWEQVGDSNEYTRSFTVDGNKITITALYVPDVTNPENIDFIQFNWTSTCPLGVVLVKSATCYNIYYYDGATSGTGLESVNGINAVSHTTFGWVKCTTDVPEFPTLALPIAAIIGLAFLMQRRKE